MDTNNFWGFLKYYITAYWSIQNMTEFLPKHFVVILVKAVSWQTEKNSSRAISENYKTWWNVTLYKKRHLKTKN